jgi:hypothetical protein
MEESVIGFSTESTGVCAEVVSAKTNKNDIKWKKFFTVPGSCKSIEVQFHFVQET